MSVRYSMVKTALEAKCRLPGGKRITDALVDAWKNLEILAPETLRLIDVGLEEIAGLAIKPEQGRPDDLALVRIHALSDELAGYCATVQLPGLDKAFIRLCQLADAVRHSTYWKIGTFEPTLMVLKMARHRMLTLSDLEKLFEGIDSCTEKYLSLRSKDRSVETDDSSASPSLH